MEKSLYIGFVNPHQAGPPATPKKDGRGRMNPGKAWTYTSSAIFHRVKKGSARWRPTVF